jgi:hypothetical protein
MSCGSPIPSATMQGRTDVPFSAKTHSLRPDDPLFQHRTLFPMLTIRQSVVFHDCVLGSFPRPLFDGSSSFEVQPVSPQFSSATSTPTNTTACVKQTLVVPPRSNGSSFLCSFSCSPCITARVCDIGSDQELGLYLKFAAQSAPCSPPRCAGGVFFRFLAALTPKLAS